MKKEFTTTRTFLSDAKTIFKYFTDGKLLEKWAFPDGMSLKIPKFNAREGGKYRYEHTSKEGVYVCEGYIEEYDQGNRLVQVDEFVKDPTGKQMMGKVTCAIDFKDTPGGVEVSLTSSGFPDEASLKDCEQGWEECLDHLSELLYLKSSEISIPNAFASR